MHGTPYPLANCSMPECYFLSNRSSCPYLCNDADFCIQFQAVETDCSKDRAAFHFRVFSALEGSATSIGGSPGRRGTMRLGTGPQIFSTASRISFTEYPLPVPRLRKIELFWLTRY